MHLDRLASLWGSPYGQLLAAKVLLFAIVSGVGAYNWRRATPRLTDGTSVRALVRSASIELAVATSLVAVTAALVGTAMPGEG